MATRTGRCSVPITKSVLIRLRSAPFRWRSRLRCVSSSARVGRLEKPDPLFPSSAGGVYPGRPSLVPVGELPQQHVPAQGIRETSARVEPQPREPDVPLRPSAVRIPAASSSARNSRLTGDEVGVKAAALWRAIPNGWREGFVGTFPAVTASHESSRCRPVTRTRPTCSRASTASCARSRPKKVCCPLTTWRSSTAFSPPSARSQAVPPVPRVFELCTDPSVIGSPFFIMERLVGEAFEYQVPAWLAAASEEVRGHMSAQWIGAVVALHRMPVESMPGPRKTPAEEASHWRDVARSAEAPQALLELLDDLTLNPPPTSGPPTPVHGDPKHGNCFWQTDGRLVALFDWEMAHVGEPLTDLGYLASFYDQGPGAIATAGLDLPGWWNRARMIAAWEEGMGRTAREIRRYEATRHVQDRGDHRSRLPSPPNRPRHRSALRRVGPGGPEVRGADSPTHRLIGARDRSPVAEAPLLSRSTSSSLRPLAGRL